MSKKPTSVVSVRIVPELLQSIRAQARTDGRSVSGEIVSILRAQIATHPEHKKSRPLTGWLSHLDVPETHAPFREGRRVASATLLRSVARVPRRGGSR